MSNLKVFSLSPIISEIFYNTSLKIFPSVLRTETKISDWQNSFLSKLEVFKMPKDWHSDKIILANAGSPIIEACVHLFEKMLIFLVCYHTVPTYISHFGIVSYNV